MSLLIAFFVCTHPVFASLDHSLFAFGGKRDFVSQQPSFPLAEERVDHPPKGGVVGVSRCVGDE
jgi:hypothetical protein